MKLVDVIDLEAQLAMDEGADSASLHARDRAIYLAMNPAPTGREPLLLGWLSRLRKRFGAPDLGAQVAHGQRLASYGLVLLGVVSGAGVGQGLLHFDEGEPPVNLGVYLLVVVFAQLATLLLLALGLLAGRLVPRLQVMGDLSRLLQSLSRRLEPLLQPHLPGDAIAHERIRTAYHRVRTRARLYRELEELALLRMAQLFGVAFNLGLLLTCLRLVLFSDLAFGWSTSVAMMDAQTVHRWCAALATPFGFLLPEAVPSLSLVERSQYFRLDGRFAGAALGSKGDAALVGQWWGFLVACTVCYGLLPRMGLLVWFSMGLARAEKRVPLDTPAIAQVVQRLTTPELSTRSPALAPQGAEPAQPLASLAPVAHSPCALVLYRDLPTDPNQVRAAVEQQLGLSVSSIHTAGGLDVAADGALCQELGSRGAPVTLVAEAWEAPDIALRRFLSGLRAALGPRVSVFVALVGEAHVDGFGQAARPDVQVYRDRLGLLEDPYLAVQALVPARHRESTTPVERP